MSVRHNVMIWLIMLALLQDFAGPPRRARHFVTHHICVSFGFLGITAGSGKEIPGFEVVFSYSNQTHVVRTNQYGSLVKTEAYC